MEAASSVVLMSTMSVNWTPVSGPPVMLVIVTVYMILSPGSNFPSPSMSPPGANAAALLAAREPASAADIGLTGDFARAGDVLVPAVGAVAGIEGSPEVGWLEIEGSSTRERPRMAAR